MRPTSTADARCAPPISVAMAVGPLMCYVSFKRVRVRPGEFIPLLGGATASWCAHQFANNSTSAPSAAARDLLT